MNVISDKKDNWPIEGQFCDETVFLDDMFIGWPLLQVHYSITLGKCVDSWSSYTYVLACNESIQLGSVRHKNDKDEKILNKDKIEKKIQEFQKSHSRT